MTQVTPRFVFAVLILLAAAGVSAADLPNISLFSTEAYGQRLDPGVESSYRISFANYGTDAHDLNLTIDVDSEATILSVKGESVSCAQSGQKIVCAAGLFAHQQQGSVQLNLRMPERRSGGRVTLSANLTISEQMDPAASTRVTFDIILVRHITVTTTADEGIGTLREAIRDANSSCSIAQPCRVVFNIPATELTNGVATIRPETPLPIVKATLVSIEGGSQKAFGGDTNPAGPEVEISGARVTTGHGIEFRSDDRCNYSTEGARLYSTSVSGLAINGFPGAGVVASLPDRCFWAPNFSAGSNYLGTDATGMRAIPNERGIMTVGMIPYISDNVLSGNRRSGGFLWGAIGVNVHHNRIGVGADGTTPLGNGSSGILVDNIEGNAIVEGNTIANNAEFGVAIARGRTLVVSDNSIHHNGLLGIDIGLNLVTPRNVPTIKSAKYDPVTDTTVITGRMDADLDSCCGGFRIYFYATSSLNERGLAQAERTLGATPHQQGGHFDFTFAAKGDLSGQWITAQTYRNFIDYFDTPSADTSELSEPVQATR